MKSRRKIWSAPLAALVLVLVLAAMVFAQASNAAPVVGTDIEDVTITIGASDSAPSPQPSVAGAFTDAEPGDDLAYTAATTNERVADVALTGVATTIVTAWWDSLGAANGEIDTDCSKRAAVLGFTAGAGIPSGQDVPDDANPHRAGIAADAAATPPVVAVDETGLCGDYDDIATSDVPDNPRTTAVETDYNAQEVVIDAFHWDMLTGREMTAVAQAAGVSSPSSYGAKFGGLTGAAQIIVSGWFDNGFLAAGTGGLAVSNDGIDSDGTNDDLPGPLTPDGRPGTATIYVRASDATGRFVTGANASDAPGQSFTVTASLAVTGDVGTFADTGTVTLGENPSASHVTADGVSGASTGVAFVAPNAAEGTRARYDLTTGSDSSGAIARVHANAGANLMQFHQKVEFILRGDNRFQVKRTGIFESPNANDPALQAADIVVVSGATLVRDEEITLTLQVNELGNVGANNEIVDVKILVVSGGEAPMLDTAGLDAHIAANPIKVREHMTGDDDVASAGLPVDFGSFASHGGGQAITYRISPSDGVLAIDANSGMLTLADPAVSATFSTDEDADNSADFTVTANDGTRSVNYEISVEITTNRPQGGDDLTAVYAEDDEDEEEPPTHYTADFEITLREDDRGKTVVDLKSLITGADDPGTLTYEITSSKPEFDIGSNEGDSEVVLSYVPDPGDVDYGDDTTDPPTLDYTGNDAVTVTIDDEYNDDANPFVVDDQGDNTAERQPDLTIVLNITVNVDRPDLEYPTVRVNVDEEYTGDILDDDGNTVSLLGEIDGATEFEIIGNSGADGSTATMADGTLDFAVATSSGVLSVGQKRDYDVAGAILNPSLTIAASDGSEGLGNITVIFTVVGINEAPTITTTDASAYVSEDAQDDHDVLTGNLEEDGVYQVTATDPEGDTLSYSIVGKDGNAVPFEIASDGKVSVKGNNALDHELVPEIEAVITASDGSLEDTLDVKIEVGNSNEAPYFVNPTLEIDVDEDEAVGYVIETYTAADPDDIVLEFTLKNQDDTEHFSLGLLSGVLTIASGLDYETQQVHLVEINVTDTSEASAEIQLTVNVTDVNDNRPAWNGALQPRQSTPENTARGVVLGNYGATDADSDGTDTVTYSLGGTDGKAFWIFNPGDDIDGDGAADDDQYTAGDLMTLESLDSDLNPMATPCNPCNITVIAADPNTTDWPRKGPNLVDTSQPVVITILGEEDSLSTPHITKANPVPGVGMGLKETALAGTKVKSGVPGAPEERPNDIPAISYTKVEGKKEVTVYPAGPVNFVETDWANWGTVLRIEVTAESPDANCGVDVTGNNNQCVEIIVKSDSSDDVIHLAAYRSGTQENRYVAAVMLVELEAHASNYKLNSGGDEIRTPIHKHQRERNYVASAAASDPALQVPRLQVDEEDEIEIEFGNLRADIDVENEPPEISNVTPEHKAAFDDADVEYTFSVTDDNSGLAEPEDLPDRDGDADYTPVVGLVSDTQCVIDDPDDGILARSIHIHESEYVDCGDNKQDGEYIASEGGYGFAPIRDDKDFDETSDGFEVETTLVLVENEIFYVTFIACDRAGNCASYDPDGNDDDEELSKITIDTELPEFVEARTGVKWDSSDNEYDDDRSFIQVIFDDLTPLNEETVETDDFVVEGHTIKAVYVYSADDEDTLWGDENSDGTLNEDTKPTRYANGGPNSEWGDRGALYRKIDRTIFLELEDELLADETPDVTVVPNGVEDQAGNEQDDGDVEAKDWIAPRFTIVSIVAADTPEGASNQLAGDGDEVTVMVTSDERLDQTRPEITVTYVDASMIDTKGVAECGTDGKRKRGEITMNTAGDTSAKCADVQLATGDDLNNNIEKITNTEWVVTVTEPKATGYYNFHITGADRSPKKNEGSEGVSAKGIVTDFFDSDGDVNTDDAVFWEADINLPNPNIRVSGAAVTDNEASVEFRSPLFVEIDFTVNHWTSVDCDDVETDDRMANCMNENSEYAEDNFDDVVVTMFQLDGVDMTDSVKSTDEQTFLASLESISVGDHTVMIQAVDQAGNTLEDTLEIDFEVNDRDPFEKRLSPGWNLVSLPGEPADSRIASVFGSDVEVRTVYTYDPVIPGGWMVAVRETLDSDWQGDLTEINGQHGYWVLSDAIQDWEVSIPRLAGGAAGTGTPIQPPVIPLYAGWNLIPVTDISGDGSGGDTLNAVVYLQSLEGGVEAARVLGFDTIRNQWETVLDPDMQMNNTLEIGAGYWIFVREATSLVPSGYISGGGSD